MLRKKKMFKLMKNKMVCQKIALRQRKRGVQEGKLLSFKKKKKID